MADDSKWEELEQKANELVAVLGFRFFAPAGTDAPIARVEDASFVDTWPMAWLPLNEPIINTPMLRLTSYQVATGDTGLHAVGRSQVWSDINIPPGSIACMLGWESVRSDIRIVSQGVIEQAYLDNLVRAMYAR